MINNSLLSPIKPIQRESVSDSILNLIFDFFTKKSLKPGDKLPTEMEFAEQLGVGRNSVREAIKVLRAMGAVEIKRGVGTFISRSVSAKVVNPFILSLIFEQGTSEELAQFRCLWEAGLAETLIDSITKEDIRGLQEVNERYKEVAENSPDDTTRLSALDHEFHSQMLIITKNKMIINIGEAVYMLYRASTEKLIRKTNPINRYRNHKRIIQYLKKRDKVNLIKFMNKQIKDNFRKMALLNDE